jgi:hypothetical protein
MTGVLRQLLLFIKKDIPCCTIQQQNNQNVQRFIRVNYDLCVFH